MNVAYMIMRAADTDLDDYLSTPYNVKFDVLIEVKKFISDATGLVFGVASYIIVIFMVLVTACDIAYITIPFIQERMVRYNWDGSSGKVKFQIVSRDAVNACREAATSVTGRSTLSLYLKKRLKTYIIAAIMLVIVLTGTDLVVDILNGIVDGIIKGLDL